MKNTPEEAQTEHAQHWTPLQEHDDLATPRGEAIANRVYNDPCATPKLSKSELDDLEHYLRNN